MKFLLLPDAPPGPLLNRLGRLIRTDTFTVFTSSGLSSGLRLLTFALLVRWLSRDDFGRWVLFQTYFTLFDTVRTGFQTAFINYASGADDALFRRWAGAAWHIAAGVTVAGVGLLGFGAFVAHQLGYGVGDPALVGWFGALAVATVPNCLSGWALFARASFRRMQSISISVQGVFLALITGGWYAGVLTPAYLYGAYVGASGLVSVLTIALGWSHWRDALTNAAPERRQLWQFGRYSVGSLFVNNLLRSSDTLLLGAVLGPVAVVAYHVPQRIVELIETINRSTVMAATPRLARLYDAGPKPMAAWFEQTAGRLWIGLLPVSLGCALFAEPLVVLLGGDGYRESATLLRIFMVFTSLSPLDRFAGIGLDAVRRPRLNLLKVGLMLLVNLAGDAVALLGFRSIEGVALASIGTFVTGMVVGFGWLGRAIPVSLGGTVRAGVRTVHDYVGRLRAHWVS